MNRLDERESPVPSPRAETGDWFLNRFGVHTRLMALPGQQGSLVDLLLRVAERLGGSPGCYLYLVSVSPVEPEVVWVTEAWRNRAQHEAALALAEVGDLLDQARRFIAQVGHPALMVPVGGTNLTTRRSAA